jgi:predicted  nucleic acid-binding Zn-ribbon protein
MNLEATLNEQLKLLIELQEIDSAIILLAEKIESHPGKLDQFKKPLKEAKAAFEKIQSKFKDLQKKRKSKEMELEEVEDKIDKLRSRRGDIKTNKEYEAHLKEIEGFEVNREKTEEDILNIMENMDNFEKEVKEEEAKVKKTESDFSAQENLIKEEQQKLSAELDEQKDRRKAFVSKLDQEVYNQYMNLLKRLGDSAVVQVNNEVCLGCNRNIPPQFYNEVKSSDDIYTCYYCKRFVYYKDK